MRYGSPSSTDLTRPLAWDSPRKSEYMGKVSRAIARSRSGFSWLHERLIGKCESSIARPIPPGTSSWPANANRVKTARIAWMPLLEYSRPVYMTGQAPAALQTRRARSRIVSAGTPVIDSATSGRKCCT